MVAAGNENAPPVDKLDNAQILELMRALELEYVSRLDGDPKLKQRPDNVVATVDLAVAAFYHSEGVPVVKIEPRDPRNRGGRHQDFRFFFAIPPEVAKRLGIKWLNSEAFKFDSSVRSLKKSCNELRNGRRG